MSVARLAPANGLLYVAMAALLAASVAVQVARDRGWQAYEPDSGVMWIRSGPLAERLALGFDNLVSDLYWMRTVVYYGGTRRAERVKNYDQLYPLLDLVTSLDPHFRVAYRFGAIFLAETFPGGAGRPDLAVQLLEKGVTAAPDRWEYLHDIGFVYYWWARDYVRAAEAFKRAGDLPGAPEWLAPLAATTLAEGGNRQSSRMLWAQLRDGADVEWIRGIADRRLQQLDAMDAIDMLQRASQDFMKRRGRAATDWRELALDQGWRMIPADPTGVPYRLDQDTGRVTLGDASVLWPLPAAGASVEKVPQP